jgi:hypothetical protein
MRGLHPMAKMQLRMLKAADFQELVDAAITMEDDFKQVQEERRKKAKLEPRKYPSNKPTPDLSSSHDRQVRVHYPGEEEETLEAKSPVMSVEPEDI